MTKKELLEAKKASIKQKVVIKRRLKVIDILLKEMKESEKEEEKEEKEKEVEEVEEEKEEEEKKEALRPPRKKRTHGRK
jgi:hypothetical protein